jgi:hypothetical protein
MNKEILKQLGLKACLDCIEHGFCPVCRQPVSNDFRDEKSKREFEISGQCQKCQDKFFRI